MSCEVIKELNEVTDFQLSQLIDLLVNFCLLRFFGSIRGYQDIFSWLFYSWNPRHFLCWFLSTSFTPEIFVSLHIVAGLSFTTVKCLLTFFNKQEASASIPFFYLLMEKLPKVVILSTPDKRRGRNAGKRYIFSHLLMKGKRHTFLSQLISLSLSLRIYTLFCPDSVYT